MEKGERTTCSRDAAAVALGDARKKIGELVGEVLEAGAGKGGMKVKKVAAPGMRRRGQGGRR